MKEIPEDLWKGLISCTMYEPCPGCEAHDLKQDLESYATGKFWQGGEDVLIGRILAICADKPLRAIEIIEAYGLNDNPRYGAIPDLDKKSDFEQQFGFSLEDEHHDIDSDSSLDDFFGEDD